MGSSQNRHELIFDWIIKQLIPVVLENGEKMWAISTEICVVKSKKKHFYLLLTMFSKYTATENVNLPLRLQKKLGRMILLWLTKRANSRSCCLQTALVSVQIHYQSSVCQAMAVWKTRHCARVVSNIIIVLVSPVFFCFTWYSKWQLCR